MRLPYPPIWFMLLLVLYSCSKDTNEPMARDCTQDLACLHDTYWRLQSVTSDIPREKNGISSTDWMQFQDTCYREVLMHIIGFTEVPEEENLLLGVFGFMGEKTSCNRQYLFDIETTDKLTSAVVSYGEPFSLWMFGDDRQPYGLVTDERWHDISISESSFRFTVDKEIGGQVYEVDVRLEGVDP